MRVAVIDSYQFAILERGVQFKLANGRIDDAFFTRIEHNRQWDRSPIDYWSIP